MVPFQILLKQIQLTWNVFFIYFPAGQQQLIDFYLQELNKVVSLNKHQEIT